MDPEHAPAGPLETARAILAGGCAVLQLRFKGSDDAEHLELARALKALASEAGVASCTSAERAIATPAWSSGRM